MKTQENMERLWKTVERWVREYRPSCPESIYQVDRVNLAAPELVEEVCDIVGYADPDCD